jgi:hypothetical protein
MLVLRARNHSTWDGTLGGGGGLSKRPVWPGVHMKKSDTDILWSAYMVTK